MKRLDHQQHGNEEQQEAGGKLSPQERLRKMVAYWMHHNEEHARSYRDWASQARAMGLAEAGLILERLADGAVLPNRDLEKVLHLMRAPSPSH
jgi:hypothetical protein